MSRDKAKRFTGETEREFRYKRSGSNVRNGGCITAGSDNDHIYGNRRKLVRNVSLMGLVTSTTASISTAPIVVSDTVSAELSLKSTRRIVSPFYTNVLGLLRLPCTISRWDVAKLRVARNMTESVTAWGIHISIRGC